MEPKFAKLADVSTKIRDPFSLAAFGILLLSISLYLISGISDSTKALLFLVIAATLVSLIAILRAERKSHEPEEFSGLRALIDSSNLPMYLTDANLVIVHCNQALAALVDTTPSSIEGKHISIALTERFKKRVPSKRKAKFETDQRALLKRAMSELMPHAERTEFVDNRDLHGNLYEGYFEVWTHVDKVRSGKTRKEMGVFGIMRVEAVPAGQIAEREAG